MKGKDEVEDFYVRIGDLMRGLRLSAQMSQETLADHLDVTFQQIQKYENGRNRMSLFKIMKVCDLFGVPLSYFADTKAKKMPQPGSIVDGEIFAMIGDLSRNQKKMVREMIRTLLGGKSL